MNCFNRVALLNHDAGRGIVADATRQPKEVGISRGTDPKGGNLVATLDFLTRI